MLDSLSLFTFLHVENMNDSCFKKNFQNIDSHVFGSSVILQTSGANVWGKDGLKINCGDCEEPFLKID